MLGEPASHRKSVAAESVFAAVEPPLPTELEALRRLLPDEELWAARRRGLQMGVGGDEVLLHAGLIEPSELVEAIAAHLDVPLADPDAPFRIPQEHAVAALRTTTVAETGPEGLQLVIAPRGKDVRRLAYALAEDPALACHVRLAAPEDLRAGLARQAQDSLAYAAAFGLKEEAPELSAAHALRGAALAVPLAAIAAALLLGFLFAPAAVKLAGMGLVSAIFLSAMGLRLSGCLIPAASQEPHRMEDRHLPVYTVIVPLYREAAMVPRLVAALRALDYPKEKLDIKLMVEPDDGGTRAAILRQHLPPSFEMIIAPDAGPRTKPKALNAALPFARGTFIAVFDAEDIPAPGQLREALAAFARGGARLACVQARLVVENAWDSWICRHFALEYCAQFDVLVPALAALRLPILLGGTSNHFRRVALERAGGWDPFNVTEDADLGLRLARMGWDVEVITSDTYEEAPVTVWAWMRQRTRWMKGWAQTILVHGRHPRRFLSDLGPARTLAAALLTLGPFAAMLVHPLSLAVVARDLWVGALGDPGASAAESLAIALCYANLLFGYGSAAVIGLVGLYRRRRLAMAPILLTLPAYWLLQSVAAWRALVDLVADPYRWDKTEHGLAGRRVRRSGAGLRRRRPAPSSH